MRMRILLIRIAFSLLNILYLYSEATLLCSDFICNSWSDIAGNELEINCDVCLNVERLVLFDYNS